MSTRWKGKRYFVVDTQGQRVSSYFRDEDEAIGEMHRLAGLSDEVPFRVVATADGEKPHSTYCPDYGGDGECYHPSHEGKYGSRKQAGYTYNKVGDTGSTVTVNFTGPSTEQELRYILREDFGVHRPELITQDGPSTWQVDFPSSKWTGKKKRAIGDSAGRYTFSALRQFVRNAVSTVPGVQTKDLSADSSGNRGIRVIFPQGVEYLADDLERGLRQRGFNNVRVSQFSNNTVLEVRTQ